MLPQRRDGCSFLTISLNYSFGGSEARALGNWGSEGDGAPGVHECSGGSYTSRFPRLLSCAPCQTLLKVQRPPFSTVRNPDWDSQPKKKVGLGEGKSLPKAHCWLEE